MLEYDGIDVPEGFDVNKTDGLRKCIICCYWYFLTVNFSIETFFFSKAEQPLRLRGKELKEREAQKD